MHVCRALLLQGRHVVGLDNFNDYYSPSLKFDRIKALNECSPTFVCEQVDIANAVQLDEVFKKHQVQYVIHLAAQAGVRYSLKNPRAYSNSNLTGFTNILESCRQHQIKHLVFASSSSVYGSNVKIPFDESDNVDHPISLYAATKKANEVMAHSYAHLFDLPCTGLRFFTVYGPWGRPDMATWLFTDAILQGKPINVFNNGDLKRDFTYVDDIVEGVIRVLDHIPATNPDFDKWHPDPASSFAPYRLYNIGNHQPVALETFISTLEAALGKPAIRNNMPMQDGDVYATYANTDRLRQAVGFSPNTELKVGLQHFVDWYLAYHRLS
ncbi:UDP-glucuronate 4-epimerase [Chitinivorax tropicus]|uniref:UDP-glucuronate 4-epimerase n=2 Tax=Chitinivorax tropicus TaxID=714531 RepID=A0A840ML51_9PROT|nr:UDP-glucuronate 4-epimerase [Chitinivorax tropicus]